MALDPRYQRYLEHFGPTVPVRDLLADRQAKDVVALRHDVDYDIDVALEAAHWEWKAGRRASYYILHGAAYWDDPRLIDKCLQLEDYGHEVGLHVNLLAEWWSGRIDDVEGGLARLIDRFRSAGIRLTGIAAHGDRLCYEAGFTNYWPFAELRPADPSLTEARVTAEGTPAREADRVIHYPPDGDAITRPDGARFPLWSVKLADHGLDYEASRLPIDHYFSDSGGTWKRSPDPLSVPFDGGRRLVLMHPLYWRGPQRHFYILSTARSGSKWLARFLDEATSLTARHEFALNHRIVDGKPAPEKRTGAGFTDLVADPDTARSLILEARAWSEGLLTDYAEANVYLERFIAQMPKGEETTFVHLHRDPKAVVRSLVERGWYNVPFDDRHPAIAVDGFEAMTQVEQAAWYVRDTNERIARATALRLPFERMVSDLGFLTDFLAGLGIAVHPRLARAVFYESLNQTRSWNVRPVEEWPAEDIARLARILEPVESDLGYRPSSLMKRAGRQAAGLFKALRAERTPAAVAPSVLVDAPQAFRPGAMTLKNGRLDLAPHPIAARFPARTASHLLIGGGHWHGRKELSASYLAALTGGGEVSGETDGSSGDAAGQASDTREDRAEGASSGMSAIARGLKARLTRALGRETGGVAAEPLPERAPWGGWPAEPDHVYTLGLEVDFKDAVGSLRIICLSHDAAGNLIAQRDIGMLSPSWQSFRRFFRPDRNAATFNIALYRSKDEDAASLAFLEVVLVSQPENRTSAETAEQVILRAREQHAARPAAELPRTQLVAGVGDLAVHLAPIAGSPVKQWGVIVAAPAGEPIRAAVVEGNKSGHLLAGGGTWRKAGAPPVTEAGTKGSPAIWRTADGCRVSGAATARPEAAGGLVGLFVLFYDSTGVLIADICPGRFSATQETVASRPGGAGRRDRLQRRVPGDRRGGRRDHRGSGDRARRPRGRSRAR
ncbi:MAG: hypothetical protein R3D33_01005 [Hyphomicrobiaceae bacterium]